MLYMGEKIVDENFTFPPTIGFILYVEPVLLDGE